jgi:hypothetical protein
VIAFRRSHNCHLKRFRQLLNGNGALAGSVSSAKLGTVLVNEIPIINLKVLCRDAEASWLCRES